MAETRKADDGQQPESLALAAEAARNGGVKPPEVELVATRETGPVPTSSKAKDEAATKVLNEGATGRDQGADEAVDALPDRTKPR